MNLVIFVLIFSTTFLAVRILIRAYVPSATAYRIRGMQFGLRVQLFRDLRRAADDDARLLMRYQAALRDLAANAHLRASFEEYGRRYGQQVQQAALHSREYALIEMYYERARQRAVAFITELTAAEIALISEAMAENLLAGRVPGSAFAKFYQEEIVLIKATPYMVERHRLRLLQRVAELQEAILKAES